jgi:hypothetical protein
MHCRRGLKPSNYAAFFLTVDPKETPEDARAAHAKLIDADGAAKAERWHFLTGPAVTPLAQSFGIGVEERARITQFVHPVGAIVLTADGRISRVLPGIDSTRAISGSPWSRHRRGSSAAFSSTSSCSAPGSIRRAASIRQRSSWRCRSALRRPFRRGGAHAGAQMPSGEA